MNNTNNIHIFILTLFIGVVAVLDIQPLQYLIIAWSITGLGLGIYLIFAEDFEMSEKVRKFLDQKPLNFWWNFFNVWLAGTMMIMVGWMFAGLAYPFCMVFLNSAHRDWYNYDEGGGGTREKNPEEEKYEGSSLGQVLLTDPVGKR
jgi:hypothetical protein